MNTNYKDLDLACEDLYRICTKWGRIGGQIKEKWGTVRFYAGFQAATLHNLIWPGYVYIQVPWWLYDLDQKLSYFAGLLGFRYLIYRYQVYMYCKGYRYILNKYPHLRYEIASCADYPELFSHFELREGNDVRYYDNNMQLLVHRTEY